MESRGYFPPEAEKRIVKPSLADEAVHTGGLHQDLGETAPESSLPITEPPAPEMLPIPAGSFEEQLQEMKLPLNTRRALVARAGEVTDIPSRITPELLMSVPGIGERFVTQALDSFASYGVRLRIPDQNESIKTIGLDHARNHRLIQQGIETFGQLIQAWRDLERRNHLDPKDSALIEHRLRRLGFIDDSQ